MLTNASTWLLNPSTMAGKPCAMDDDDDDDDETQQRAKYSHFHKPYTLDPNILYAIREAQPQEVNVTGQWKNKVIDVTGGRNAFIGGSCPGLELGSGLRSHDYNRCEFAALYSGIVKLIKSKGETHLHLYIAELEFDISRLNVPYN